MSHQIRALATVALAMLFIAGATLVFGAEEQKTQGVELYQKLCSGCHSSIRDSEKAGRSAGRIRSAMRMFGQHKPFTSLSDEQISVIALTLKDVEI